MIKQLDQFENPYYEELLKIKTSEELNSKLGLYHILRKDYKNFKFNSNFVGVSTIDLSIPKAKLLGNLEEEAKEILKQKSLDSYILLATVRHPDKIERQIIIFPEN